MKKVYLFILLFALILPKTSLGEFLSDPTDLDLYKKIDKGYYDLELKYLDKELKGGDVNGNIVDDLNKRAKQNDLEECFSGDIKTKDVKDIYNDKDTNVLLKEALKDCFDEEHPLSLDQISKYYAIIEESFSQNSIKAQKKVDNIYKIGRIGMYSDGLLENSPFDLMNDLDEINSIIFEEQIPYNGVNNYNLGASINGILSGLNPFDTFDSNRYYNNDSNNSNSGILNSNSGINLGDEVCLDDANNSGLNLDDFNKILNSNISNQSLNNTENIGGSGTGGDLKTSYKKVNDNWWPCNNFFCIAIDFVVYNHKLLGGGTNLSIEGLFKRSNEHLKKFSSTSLIQSKMTTNNFELGLKDLNLPDIFHVGVQVSYKPVPLLNIDKEEKNLDDNEFEYKNLFTKYYANLGLDYNRANDMSLYNKAESKYKTTLDSAELPITTYGEKLEKLESFTQELIKQNEYISQTLIDKKVIGDDIKLFQKKYMELEIFARALMEYTFGAKGIITEMNKIPQGG
ncbi:hypothetical protein H3C61_04635 [Candidatus Gracilibacteria bacterium]|nr:hypothetical protein [Candidatus Gracilibacteria bacterium]